MARVFPLQDPRVPHGLKVLIVEDDDLVRKAHEDILISLGVETQTVKNGKEALDLIGTVERKFDLILMARIMPVMDGITATKKLRHLDYPAQIIGVSRRLTNDEYGEFKEAELDDLHHDGIPLPPHIMKLILKRVLPSKPCNGHQN